jgi:acetyl esterase/lipase
MKNVIFILFLMCSINNVYSQPKTILLYPNGAPGLLKPGIPEDSETSEGITRVKDITQPALFVYQPKVKTSDAAVIICPGGGYGILAIDHEGYEIAEWINEHGVTAFVLKYRLPQDELFENAEIRPLQDAQKAIQIVRSSASEYGISVDKIGIMGFSAGGHLASTASTHFDKLIGDNNDKATTIRPDFSILIYPVITFSQVNTHIGSRDNLVGENPTEDKIIEYSNELHVTADTPPAFLVSTTDDWVSPENSILYFEACRKNKVPVEMHIYEKGGHGYALKKNDFGPVETWPDRLADWMKKRKLML